LFLRIRPNGAKTWQIEYVHTGRRRKCTIGSFDASGAPGNDIEKWLNHRRLTLAQARLVARTQSQVAECSGWLASAQNITHQVVEAPENLHRARIDRICGEQHGWSINHAHVNLLNRSEDVHEYGRLSGPRRLRPLRHP
jgi:hypothetical protein